MADREEIPELISDLTLEELSGNTNALMENIDILFGIKNDISTVIDDYNLGLEEKFIDVPTDFKEYPYALLSIIEDYDVKNNSIDSPFLKTSNIPFTSSKGVSNLSIELSNSLCANMKIKRQLAYLLNNLSIDVPTRYRDYSYLFSNLFDTVFVLSTDDNEKNEYNRKFGFYKFETIPGKNLNIRYDYGKEYVQEMYHTYEPSQAGIHYYSVRNTISKIIGLESLDTTTVSSHYEGKPLIEIVRFGSNLSSLGKWAFACCVNLSAINLADSHIRNLEMGCMRNTGIVAGSVKFPKWITSLPDTCFRRCHKLQNIDWLEDTEISSFGTNCFYQNGTNSVGDNFAPAGPGLSSIRIGKKIQNIGYDCFGFNNWSQLQNHISVSTENKWFENAVSKDGVVDYNSIVRKSDNCLIHGNPSLATDNVFQTLSVESIQSHAFSQQSFSSITFPNTIKRIDANALNGITNDTSTVVPLSIFMTDVYDPPVLVSKLFFTQKLSDSYTQVFLPISSKEKYLDAKESTNWAALGNQTNKAGKPFLVFV